MAMMEFSGACHESEALDAINKDQDKHIPVEQLVLRTCFSGNFLSRNWQMSQDS